MLHLNAHDERLYNLEIVGHRKYDLSRTAHVLPVVPPHEALDDEVASNPAILQQLQASTLADEWPSSFGHRSDAAAEVEPLLPCALYLDGLPYTKGDSILGVWVFNLVTGLQMSAWIHDAKK